MMASAAQAQTPRSNVDMPASRRRPAIPRSQDRPDLDAAQCRPAERPADAGRPRLRSAGPGRLCPGRGDATAQHRAAGRRCRSRPARPCPSSISATPRCSAVPGKRWEVVLYLDNNSADTVVPLLNCRFTNARQAGRGDACAGARGRPRPSRRHDHLRPQGRPLRRPRHLRVKSPIGARPPARIMSGPRPALLSPAPNSRRRR